MAGHSKFKNIMHRKGAQDAKRGKLFNRLSKEIIVAARSGSDVSANSRLRTAILAARKENMPNDRINNAVKIGSGEIGSQNLEEIRYEGYGPGGVAIVIETMTDNRNRTAAEIRSAFSKNNGNMGETGSVGFMFARKGFMLYPLKTASADAMFEAALEAGAENCETTDEAHEITCPMEDFGEVQAALVEKFGEAEEAKLQWIAQTPAPVDDETAPGVMKLLAALDDLDDAQEVTSNAEFSADAIEKMSA